MIQQESIRILQYNVQKSKNTVIEPLFQEDGIREYDVITIQEPWRNMFQNTSVQAKSAGFHLVYPDDEKARSCIYVSDRIDQNQWDSTIHNPDLVTVRIRMNDEVINIHSIYNPPPGSYTERAEEASNELENAVNTTGHHVITGDFNLHHPEWSEENCQMHEAAEALLDVTTRYDMKQMVPNGTVTWQARGSQQTLDLTWVSSELANRVLICQVKEEMEQGSDHFPIKTRIIMSIPMAKPRERRVWKNANEEKIREWVASRMEANRAITSEIHLEQAVTRLTEDIQGAIREFVPIAKPSQYAKPYWTTHCTELISEAKAARRQYRRTESEEDYIRYRQAVNKKGNEIRRRKQEQFRKDLAEATEKSDLWRIARKAKETSRSGPLQVPPLRNEDQSWATTNEEKAERLRERFFPPPAGANLEDIQNAVYPEEFGCDITVTEEEIQKIIQKFKPDKAPGPDGITNRILRILSETAGNKLAHLANTCITLGHFPSQFKEAITVVLPKPGKPVEEAGSYRPIALLNTIGKVIETAVVDRIRQILEETNGLPQTQMGARKGRSIISALQLLTEQIYTAWNSPMRDGQRFIVSALCLDMAGAFDYVSHERLIHELRKKGIPSKLVKVIRSFLSERKTTIRFGSF